MTMDNISLFWQAFIGALAGGVIGSAITVALFNLAGSREPWR
jgi:hypothetical protein